MVTKHIVKKQKSFQKRKHKKVIEQLFSEFTFFILFSVQNIQSKFYPNVKNVFVFSKLTQHETPDKNIHIKYLQYYKLIIYKKLIAFFNLQK